MGRLSMYRVAGLLGILPMVFGSGIAHAQAGLPMSPGSVLAVSAFDTVDYVLEYAPSGQLLGQLEIIDPGNVIGIPSGVAIAGGRLWVAGRDSVARVNPATGAVEDGFSVASAPNLVGIADFGNSLLVAEVHPDRVHRFTLDGDLIDTIELVGDTLLITGVDTDGVRLHVSTHVTGDIHVFGFDGVQVDLVTIGFVADLTGATVDAANEELWVVTGTGVNEIHRFTLGGDPVGSFPAEADGIMGLHVISDQLFADGFETGDLFAWGALAQ